MREHSILSGWSQPQCEEITREVPADVLRQVIETQY